MVTARPDVLSNQGRARAVARRRAAWVLAGCGFVLGAFLRLEPVGGSFLFGDEYHSLEDVARGFRHVTTRFDSTGSGLALPLLQLGLLAALPMNHWVVRAPAWVPALLLIGLCHPLFRRHVGATGAAIATALLAVSPLLVFYAHFARAYALAALLCLGALAALETILSGPRARGPALVALTLCTAAAPWAQATSLAFVAPACVGGLVALFAAPTRRADALRVLGAIGVAAAICVLLHLPAWDSVAAFASGKTTKEYYGRFDALDVAVLLTGGGVLAWFSLAVVGASLAGWLAARRLRGLPMLFACVGPAVALVALRPYGDAYAYARYALPAVIPAALVVGWAIDRALGGRAYASLAAGAAVAVALLVAGPYGLRRVDDGPYANTYLTMQPLPAFDVPFLGAPAFYADLAARPARERAALRIIEVPALMTRSRQYYRNLYLQHGVETLLGILPNEMRRVPSGPYVDLRAEDWAVRADADFLILHLDPKEEVEAYWKFVFGPATREETSDPSLVAFMERQLRFGGESSTGQGLLANELRERFGRPVWTGPGVAVFRLR